MQVALAVGRKRTFSMRPNSGRSLLTASSVMVKYGAVHIPARQGNIRISAMKIGFNSIVWDEVATLVSAVLVDLEDRIALGLDDKNYGGNIGKFLAVLVAVDKDDNQRFANNINCIGYSVKSDGSREREIRIAIQVLPSDLTGLSYNDIARLFISLLIAKMDQIEVRIPRTFDWVQFSIDIKVLLEIYRATLC